VGGALRADLPPPPPPPPPPLPHHSLRGPRLCLGGWEPGFASGFTPDEWMQQLLDRAKTAERPGDRAEALAVLRDTTEGDPQAMLALGAVGVPLIEDLVRGEEGAEGQNELRVAALELLSTLLGVGQDFRPVQSGGAEVDRGGEAGGVGPPAGPSRSEMAAQAVRINSEIFLKDGDGRVGLLLEVLLREDRLPAPLGQGPAVAGWESLRGGDKRGIFMRLLSAQCLGALERMSPWRVQEAVLVSPNGVVRLVDLAVASNPGGSLRAAVLQLLGALTANSPNAIQLVAFEGGMEKSFGLVAEEGGSEGGSPAALLALELLHNLLRDNPATQLLLRENGTMARLPELLAVPQKEGRGGGIGAKAAGVALSSLGLQGPMSRAEALESILALVVALLAPEATRQAHQACLAGGGCVKRLLDIAVERSGAGLPETARVAALHCLALLVSQNFQTQERLGAAMVRECSLLGTAPEMPALTAILNAALLSREQVKREAARATVQSFFSNNGDGQLLLASTLDLAAAEFWDGGHDQETSFGGALLRSLFRPRTRGAEMGAAAALLSDLMAENPSVKQRLQNVGISGRDGAASVPLLQDCLTLFAGASTELGVDLAAEVAPLLQMLLVWMQDFPDAVGTLLSSSGNVPPLIDLVGKGGPVAGLSAAVLAECVLAPASVASGDFTPADVVKAVASQIGLNVYFEAFGNLLESPEFLADLHSSEAEESKFAKTSPSAYGQGAAAHIADLHARVKPAMVQHYTQKAPAAAVPPPELSAMIQGNEKLGEYLSYMQQELTRLKTENHSLKELTQGGGEEASVPSGGAPTASLSAAVVADPQLQVEMGRLEGQLRQAEERARGAEAAASQRAADLSALSGSYSALESHSFSLESQLQAAQKQLQGAQTAGAAAAASVGSSPAEVDVLLARARDETRAEVEAEGDEAMNDLLVCLGQEERKVEALSEKLAELGEDADAIVEAILAEEEADGGPGA